MVIRGINGNYDLLRLVMDHEGVTDFEQMICLGNVVGLWNQNNECIAAADRFAVCLKALFDDCAGSVRKLVSGSPNKLRIFEWATADIDVSQRSWLDSRNAECQHNGTWYSSWYSTKDLRGNNVIGMHSSVSIGTDGHACWKWGDKNSTSVNDGVFQITANYDVGNIFDTTTIGIAKYAVIFDDIIEFKSVKYNPDRYIQHYSDEKLIENNYLEMLNAISDRNSQDNLTSRRS